MPPPPPRCARHFAELAGWWCEDCQRPLCPDCAGTKRVQGVELVVCMLCQGRAVVLRGRRAETLAPPTLRQLLGFPLHRQGRVTFWGSVGLFFLLSSLIAVVLGGLSRFPALYAFLPLTFLQGVIAVGLATATLLWLIQDGARGGEFLTPPEFGEAWHDVVRPAVIALLATV